MKAIGKYIVINPLRETDVKTKGGLILADSQRDDVRYRQAEIINVGNEVSYIKKGDNIYYDKAAGFNIEIKNDVFKVIKEIDVVVVL
jgi:co-chaperonin GroES (HSP10)